MLGVFQVGPGDVRLQMTGSCSGERDPRSSD